MSVVVSKIIITGLLLLFLLLTGYLVSRSGKPYGFLFTVHKLIGVAIGAYLVITVYRRAQAAPLGQPEIAAIAASVLFFAGLVATGGLLSVVKSMPMVISWTHKIFPYLAVLSTGITIYLLF